MQTSKIKNWIIIALTTLLAILSTCEFSKPVVVPSADLQDTIFLSQWRREKAERALQTINYTKQVERLQKQKDSLQKTVDDSKAKISRFRTKAGSLEKQLQAITSNTITGDSVSKKEIAPLVDSLVIAGDNSDRSCDETIVLLETIVANRDSSIIFQKQIEANLRDLGKEQELRNKYLTDQLNIAYKAQKRKTRQNKLLAGGLLILSGITTSLLISHSVK